MKITVFGFALVFLFIMLSSGITHCNTKENVIKQGGIGENKYSWQESDSSLMLLNNSKIVWKLNYNRERGKPYFSPLNTIDGHDLVWLRPEDHPWHYGLWFSWKYINHINFWEEDKVTGISEGKAVVESISTTLGEHFTATVKMNISYAKVAGNPILLEHRTIKIFAPDAKGNYHIDWSFDWTPQQDTIVFDRTLPEKFGGPRYGGYAGLSYRASPEMSQHKYRHANNFETEEELVGYGEKAAWMDLSGSLTDSKEKSGLTIFGHPENQVEDVRWYIYKGGDFAFFNASPVFNKPITVLPDETLKHRYRTLVQSKALDRVEINKHYQGFIGSIEQEN